jgi:hypothetical protein
MKTKAKFSTPMVSERSSGRSSVLLVWLTLVFVIGLCHPLGFAQEAVVLVGSGSSVPAPLYNKWTQEYNKRNPGIQMKYVPMGTSEGIKQISHGSGDFGAGEAQLTAMRARFAGVCPSDQARARGGRANASAGLRSSQDEAFQESFQRIVRSGQTSLARKFCNLLGGGVVHPLSRDVLAAQSVASQIGFRNQGEIAFSLLWRNGGEHLLRSAHRQNILLASKVMTTGT